MTDYTPAIGAFRDAWVRSRNDDENWAFIPLDSSMPTEAEAEAQFDRWFAAELAKEYQRGCEHSAKVAEDYRHNYPLDVWPELAEGEKDAGYDRVSASMARHTSSTIARLIRAYARGDGEQA